MFSFIGMYVTWNLQIMDILGTYVAFRVFCIECIELATKVERFLLFRLHTIMFPSRLPAERAGQRPLEGMRQNVQV